MRSSLVSTPEIAQLIILIVGAIGMVVWLSALLLWLLARELKFPPAVERFIPGKSPPAVRDQLPRAAALQEPMWELIGGDATHAVFQVALMKHLQFRVDLQAQDQGCRVQIVSQTPMRIGWLQWLTVIWLVLEPMVIVTLGVILWVFVAGSSNLVVRGQAIQMVQIVHVLWPPFIFWSIGRKMGPMARTRQQRFLTMLELL